MRELDEEQIKVGLESLERFLDEYFDRRKIIYSGSGALFIFPNEYKGIEKNYLRKIANILKSKDINKVSIKFWKDFGEEYSIVVFAIDLSLRLEVGIENFVNNHSDNIKKLGKKAENT